MTDCIHISSTVPEDRDENSTTANGWLFLCKSGEFLSSDVTCDGNVTCADGSDEDHDLCCELHIYFLNGFP